MDLQGKALSASMIKTFLECPRKFQKRYVEKIKMEQEALHLPLGTAFHSAMEAANTVIYEKGPFEKFTPDQIEEFKDVYRRTAVKLGLHDMTMLNDGLELVENSLDKLNPNKVILGVEREFNIMTPDGVPTMGYIDSIEQISETEVLINDYKTSRVALSTEEAREDIQLALYDFAASVMYPQFSTVWVQLDYIRQDRAPVRIKRTPVQRQNFLKFVKSVYDEMLAYEPDPETKGRINKHCGFCDYRNSCQQFIALTQSYDINLTPIEKMSNDQLVTEHEELTCAKKAIESRLGQVKLGILGVMEEANDKIHNDDKEVYIQQNTAREHDVVTVLKKIPTKDLSSYNIVKVSNKGLTDYFKKNPNIELQKLLDSKAHVKWNNPSIRTKKAKN